MKKYSFFILLAIAAISVATAHDKADKKSQGDAREICISATSETMTITTFWAEMYNSANNAGVKVRVVSGDNNENAGVCFTSKVPSGYNYPTDARITPVAREAIVAICSSTGRTESVLDFPGINSVVMGNLLTGKRSVTWGEISGTNEKEAVKLLVSDDSQVIEAVSGFASVMPEDLSSAVVTDTHTLLSTVKGDHSVIAICYLSDITDIATASLAEGVRLIPVDVNRNGISDYNERFYDSYMEFSRGLYLGKYPGQLVKTLYAVPSGRSLSTESSALLRYILTEGQKALPQDRWSPLAPGESQTRIEGIENTATYFPSSGKEIMAGKAFIPAVALLALVIIVAILFYRNSGKAFAVAAVAHVSNRKGLSDKSALLPRGIYYDPRHSWAFLEKDGRVRTGLNDFLNHITGPVSRVDTKAPGERVKKGEQMVTVIQKGKRLVIRSPVTGIIDEVNEFLTGNPGLLYDSPYSEGWIYTIMPESWKRESAGLLMADSFREFLRKEYSRLKDFIAELAPEAGLKSVMPVLQDGGELNDNLLESASPITWEEFQKSFLD